MKNFLTIFLLSFSINGYCEWTVVDPDKDGTGYIDFSTIKRISTTVRVWEMVDYKNTQSLGTMNYNSVVSLREYDCSQERVRVLTSTYFSNSMGSGNPIKDFNKPTDWRFFPPRTVGSMKLDMLCK
jgi:hypothetical protein